MGLEFGLQELSSQVPGSVGVVSSGFATGLVLALFLIGLAMTIATAIAWWKIFFKAGFNGAFGLLVLIPGVGAILPLILGFINWPLSAGENKIKKN